MAYGGKRGGLPRKGDRTNKRGTNKRGTNKRGTNKRGGASASAGYNNKPGQGGLRGRVRPLLPATNKEIQHAYNTGPVSIRDTYYELKEYFKSYPNIRFHIQDTNENVTFDELVKRSNIEKFLDVFSLNSELITLTREDADIKLLPEVYKTFNILASTFRDTEPPPYYIKVLAQILRILYFNMKRLRLV